MIMSYEENDVDGGHDRQRPELSRHIEEWDDTPQSCIHSESINIYNSRVIFLQKIWK